MKILYLSTPAYADTDAPLLKSLSENGNKIMYLISVGDRVSSTLISLDENHEDVGIYKWTEYPELKFIASYIGIDNIFTIRRKNRKSSSEAKVIRTLLQKVVDDFKPDVIHQIDLPYWNMLPFVFNNRKRYVLTVHDPIPHIGEKTWKLDISRRIVFPFVSKIIILNNKSKETFVNRYFINRRKVHVSRFGFLEWMKEYTSINQPENYILFYGRITPYKGVEYLLRAMKIVHDKYPKIRLVVAGSGKYYFDKKAYESLDYITIINRFIELEELSNLILNARFVICPYTEATQSGVVASVLALETPIIVTNVGALPEMVEDMKTGLVIPPGNVSAIVDSICTLLANDTLLTSMRESIKEQKNSGKYNWKDIALLTEKIYKS